MQLPAGKDARLGGVRYQRHRPEQTLLYRLVEDHYPRFLEQLTVEGKTLPDYVRREFEDYLQCGRLEHGFLRIRCDRCHAERLLAFSCKHRAFCPSCGARRMAETAAQLIDRVLPEQPIRQWVLSVPIPLRFLFASRPAIMGKVLGIVYRTIATHLIHKAGHTQTTAKTGAVTLIQYFGGSVNLNIHYHMLFLDGVYVDGPHGLRFRWVKAPTSSELTHLAQTIAHRTARFLECQGLLERDAEQAYLTSDIDDDEAMGGLLEPAITYRIAVGPHQGRKVMTLQTLPPDGPFEPGAGQVAGFSLHAGVAARAHERESWNACAVTFPDRRSPNADCRSPPKATYVIA